MEVNQVQLQQQHPPPQQQHQQPLGVPMSDPSIGAAAGAPLLPPHAAAAAAQLGHKQSDAGINEIATRLLATALQQQPGTAGMIPPPFGAMGPANPPIGIPNLSLPPPGYMGGGHPPGVPNMPPNQPHVQTLPVGVGLNGRGAGFQVGISSLPFAQYY